VQPFGSTGEKRQISPDGGPEPRWRRDGNELFYLASRGTLMSVAVPGGNAVGAAAPQALFDVGVPLTSNPYPDQLRRHGHGKVSGLHPDR